jgi:inner membrane protein involved in colicin E2 resistance
MRWWLLAFLVSLVALLVAAAGMVRHVWRQRAALRRDRKDQASGNLDQNSPAGSPEIAILDQGLDEELDVK